MKELMNSIAVGLAFGIMSIWMLIIVLISWLFVGALVVTQIHSISHISYFWCWLVYIIISVCGIKLLSIETKS